MTSRKINKNLETRSIITRIDKKALERLKELRLNASFIEGVSIGMTELTRRINNTSSFDMIEKEILEDARIKKEMRRK